MSNIISGIIGAITGAIFSGWIAWLIAKRSIEQTNLASLALDRIQERDKATATFRLAFLELLLFLKFNIRPDGFTDFVSFLHNLYPKHAAAVITVIPFLNKSGIKRINKAWFDYCFPNGIKEGTDEESKYAFPLDDYATIHEPQKIALEKIEILFATDSHNKFLL